MKIFIVGSGKLANALLSSELTFPSHDITKWESNDQSITEKSIIVHAGSGRQLKECIDFCKRTSSVFIELSTGLETERMDADFTLLLCPNTSILLLKTLNMVKRFGHHFEGYKVSITESHQSGKTSAPGTAFSFAQSLKVPVTAITSVREQAIQHKRIGIPDEYLDKHAYHKITIEDSDDEVSIETKVLGHSSYVHGVKKIIEAVLKHALDKKSYSVFDLIDQNFL
jgi:4-hydroxy-tetrahydrodipicolinate reductase